MKCEHCNKRTKKLYYHSNKKNSKKWIPIVNYCFHCSKFNGSTKEKRDFDRRYKLRKIRIGEYCNRCHCNMLKLYAIFRKNEKQVWIPVFWYCMICRKVVVRV